MTPISQRSRRWLTFAGACVATAILAACAGGKDISVGDTSTTNPTPTPSGTATSGPPSAATFDAKVEPFLETNTCGRSGCHIPPTGTGSSGHNYAVKTTAPSASDKTANYDATICNPRFTTYGASPVGNFLTHMCTSKTAGANHNGITPTSQNCTDFYNWAGEGSGSPPACP